MLMRLRYTFATLVVCSLVILLAAETSAQRLEIPRRHDAPPGPAISAAQALSKMSVPAGFHVEIVAEEPDIINPVAMAIDEKGRFWITESFEYPRREPGIGRDRIKVLEDTDHDGKVDKVTVFAEGLNIPSGIAVGYGGVWVANAPDLLFLEDTDGDLKADKTTTLLTGFGRTDTHELPSAFTWGPDGWLYGLNGVFNYCDVHYAPANPNYRDDHPGWEFTCAMWRINPWSKEFQVFAEGTSNPWGIAINNEGDFFVSACVIDHLWHITEGAYYIRQGGPYPPQTWPLRSIVNHTHQKAAYCGITYYDSDAYPAEYRNVLYMGNIHGGCLNADTVERKGSSYFGKPKPDFLTANHAWFMPVAQLTGPDGCLYVLDWYDQYHCYQDANADPEGVERGRGRLYKVVYDGTDPGAKRTRLAPPDIGSLASSQLVALLASENGFERWTAQRLLAQRSEATIIGSLKSMAADKALPARTRLHALWSIGSMKPSDASLQAIAKFTESEFVEHSDTSLAIWAMRMLGNAANERLSQQVIAKLASHESAAFQLAQQDSKVCLEMITTLAKASGIQRSQQVAGIAKLAAFHVQDETIQHVAYNRLRQLSDDAQAFASLVAFYHQSNDLGPYAEQWAVALLEWSRSTAHLTTDHTVQLLSVLLKHSSNNTALGEETLRWLQKLALDANRSESLINTIRSQCLPAIQSLSSTNKELMTGATLASASLGDAEALMQVERIATARETNNDNRVDAIRTLISTQPNRVHEWLPGLLKNHDISVQDRAAVIDVLGTLQNNQAAQWLSTNFSDLESGLQPRVIELLTQRPAWATLLLQQVTQNHVPKDRFNLNHLRRLTTFQDKALQGQVASIFGSIREGNSDQRNQVVSRMRDLLGNVAGDPFAGRAVFKRVCSQCHMMYGEGYNVGPDITLNGRSNWQQLIQNVFDPSAVIGPGYQAVLVLTDDGRVLTGIPVEETAQSVSLKMQGGKLETISKNEIEEIKRSEVSLMPEQLENQMTNQEMADLFAFLALDKPPEDDSAVLLSGAPPHRIRENTSKP